MMRKITAAVAVAAALVGAGLVTGAAAADRAGLAGSSATSGGTSPTAVKARATARDSVTSSASSPASTAATSSRTHATSPTAAVVGPPAAPAAPAAPAGEKVIYLTFDDGPDPVWTPQILQLLTENHATATFFDIGENVVGRAYLVRDIRAQGSQVGNHTWDHPSLTGLTDAQITRELDRTDSIQGTARCVRPPYGATDDRVNALIQARGQRVELWNVDTRDWARPGVAAIVQQLLGARDGSTVLMHTGGGDRSETVAALRIALPQLGAEGFALQGIPGC